MEMVGEAVNVERRLFVDVGGSGCGSFISQLDEVCASFVGEDIPPSLDCSPLSFRFSLVWFCCSLWFSF
jgi:hypothetical protein